MAKDFYENYRSLHEEINRAYEVVKYHPSSILANEIAEIEKTIDSIDLIGNLEGSVIDSFNNVKNSFVLNIRAVKESVQGSFAEADSLYIDLKVLLETLKINNYNYQTLVSREPQEENYKETITYIDNLGKQQTNTTINRVAYNRDHQLWEGKVSEFETNFVALTDKINAAKNDLDSINNNPFSLKNINVSLPTKAESEVIFANATPLNAKVIDVPLGLGTKYTYMGWQKVTANGSRQLALRISSGQHFDDRGFATIDGRYVLAMTSTYGEVGDYVDVYLGNGQVIHGIIGDVKSQTIEAWDQNPANEWGHDDGEKIVEFIVDCNGWYTSSWKSGRQPNPGQNGFLPEFSDNGGVIKVVNEGINYFEQNGINPTGYSKSDLTSQMKNNSPKDYAFA